MSANPEIVEAAEDAGLRYVSDSLPGITRERHGARFRYRTPEGKPLRDPREIDRINKLAIPPAYERVWICPDPNGHLQATGFDARGRKQYRYHPRFRAIQDENKFKRMLAFGRALPRLRARIEADMRRKGLPKVKALAVVVYLLERSLIRVGNEEYARQNRSFGLTTLRNRHVKVHGERIEFQFVGKSKVKHRIEIHDPRLARVIKRLQDLPGQELFQYVDEEGAINSISSADVNAYLHEIAGERFTAKDVRTWWGSVLALIELAHEEKPTTKMGLKRATTRVMTAVSRQLGNTPAVCRKGYVHPVVVGAFAEGRLRAMRAREDLSEFIGQAEAQLIDLLASKSAPSRAA